MPLFSEARYYRDNIFQLVSLAEQIDQRRAVGRVICIWSPRCDCYRLHGFLQQSPVRLWPPFSIERNAVVERRESRRIGRMEPRVRRSGHWNDILRQGRGSLMSESIPFILAGYRLSRLIYIFYSRAS